MQMPAILEGESLTRFVQGAIAGVIATVVIGFNWGGWTLESTAKQQSEKYASAAWWRSWHPCARTSLKALPMRQRT